MGWVEHYAQWHGEALASGRAEVNDAFRAGFIAAAKATETEQRAVEALKAFPLPSPNATSMGHYLSILAWLHDGRPDVASLIIDLEFPQYTGGGGRNMTDLPPEYLDPERRLNAALSVLEGRTITPELMWEARRLVFGAELRWYAELGKWTEEQYLPWLEWVDRGMPGEPPCEGGLMNDVMDDIELQIREALRSLGSGHDATARAQLNGALFVIEAARRSVTVDLHGFVAGAIAALSAVRVACDS